VADVLHANEFRLSYGECDPAGIVYYATYYPWMERTHTEWTFLRGVRSDHMAANWGVSTVSRASGCEYFAPAKLFDPLRCEMRLGRLGQTSFTMRYDFVRTTDDTLMCVGTMTLVFVGDDVRPRPVPEPMRELLLSAGPAAGLER
jgi:acyl-CoA thioester hydrolase